MINEIINLCSDFLKSKNKNFDGIGLVVYTNIKDLPVISMNKNEDNYNLPMRNYNEILETLLNISSYKSEFQDGFHLLSKDLELTHISQYFSTPIVRNLTIKNNYGSRFRTALYGSYLENVLYTIIISKCYGLLIFCKGQIIFENNEI